MPCQTGTINSFDVTYAKGGQLQKTYFAIKNNNHLFNKNKQKMTLHTKLNAPGGSTAVQLTVDKQ